MVLSTPDEVLIAKAETQKFQAKTKFEKTRAKALLPPKRKIFGKAPEPETFTKEQRILQGLFGGGDKIVFNTDGERHPPQINMVLTSGSGGISRMKNLDGGQTQNLMVSGRPSGFFGGQRAQRQPQKRRRGFL